MLPTLMLLAAGVYWAIQEARREETPGKELAGRSEKGSFMRRAEDETQVLIESALSRVASAEHRPSRAVLVQQQAAEEAELSAADRDQNRQLLIGAATVGLAAGGLLFPPLSLLTTPLFAYLSVPIYKQAVHDLRKERRIKISGFLALLSTGTWLIGAKVTSAISLLSLQLAEKISTLTQDRTQKILRGLFARHQSKVFVFRDGVEVEVLLDQVQVGDELVLHAGQIIPVDGVVTDGMATVDQHQLTGESRLIEKGESDFVLSQTFIQRGRLRVRVERAGSDTLAAQTQAILERTTNTLRERPDRGQRLANKTVAPSLVIIGAALPFYGVRSSMALLSAMPGVDMYYAGPVALMTFLEMAAERQILIKDGRSLELLRTIDTVIFDKTGTLTDEQPVLAQIHCFADLSAVEILSAAAAVEQNQTHPVANAILTAARQRGLGFEDVFESRYEVGFGIAARSGKRRVRIGSERFMVSEKLRLPARARAVRAAAAHAGHTMIYLASGRRVVGALELRPILRPEVQEVLADLRRRNLKLHILSGDQQEPTQRLAELLGIDSYTAEVLPQGKAAIVEQLQRAGRKVCFVGDGVNDAIALKQADVSISMQGATRLATDTAQILFMDQGLRRLPQLLDMARTLERNVNTSFGISLAVSGTLLTCVLLLNGHIGILLAAGSASLLLVVANALSSRWTFQESCPT